VNVLAGVTELQGRDQENPGLFMIDLQSGQDTDLMGLKSRQNSMKS
jgi:hypothetical protein